MVVVGCLLYVIYCLRIWVLHIIKGFTVSYSCLYIIHCESCLIGKNSTTSSNLYVIRAYLAFFSFVIKLTKVLDDLQQNQLFKGCRHILVCEEEKWITREDVFQGLQVLEDRGLTFDLLPTFVKPGAQPYTTLGVKY